MKTIQKGFAMLVSGLVLCVTPFAFAANVFVELDETEFTINGEAIPLSPEKKHFIAALGEPSRIDKKEHGVVCIYDDLGINYRTGVESDKVSDITFYLKDGKKQRNSQCSITGKDKKSSIAPHEMFNGSLKVTGKEFPLRESLKRVMKVIPGLKPKTGTFGVLASVILGERELLVEKNPFTDDIEEISILTEKCR